MVVRVAVVGMLKVMVVIGGNRYSGGSRDGGDDGGVRGSDGLDGDISLVVLMVEMMMVTVG